MTSKRRETEKGVELRARINPGNVGDIDHFTPVEDARKGVQSIDRAFGLLRLFELSPRPLSVSALAQRSKMTASQAHHYLVSLVRSGVIRQTRDGTYELGTFALQLGLTALSRIEPIEQAAQAARELRDDTGEAVFIALWGSHGPTIIRYYEGFQPITVEVRTGNVMPVESSATGHVFLAWESEAIIQNNIERSPQTDEICRKARAAGLARVDGTLLPRIAALSAPVFGYDNRLEFALTVLGWSGELDDSLDGALATKLRTSASRLSSMLGHRVRKKD